MGYANPSVNGVKFVEIAISSQSLTEKVLAAMALKAGFFEHVYWSSRSVKSALSKFKHADFDLILANDIHTLPLAFRLSHGAKIILDAHEYAPREFDDSWKWRFFLQRYNEFLCNRYIPRVDGMITVCQGIAEEYEKNYGIHPKVVINAPFYQDLSPNQNHDKVIHMVHHGAAIPSRNIELMIETMDYLDERFHLDLILVPSVQSYIHRLESMAEKNPRIRILPPVQMRELPRYINQYDVGIYLLKPNNFNNWHTLPNKFFEFIQARLAVAIGPSPEMVRLVKQYDCGVVAEDFTPQALASKLDQLDRERVNYYKSRSHTAAKDLCFEKSSEVLLALVNKVMGNA